MKNIGSGVLAIMTILASGCAKKPSALDVCKQLEGAGVAANCRTTAPGGIGAAAVEAATFDLPSVPGKTGQVLRHDSEEKYTTTENAFNAAAVLAGPHRYGSKKVLIFVQINSGLSAADGAKAKAVVDAL